MSNQMRSCCVTLFATVIGSHAHVALGDNVWPGDIMSVPRGVRGAAPGINGAFGGGRPPGEVFGFNRSYLLTRRYTAIGGLGTVSRGTPQTLPKVPHRTSVLLRAAKSTAGSLAETATEPDPDWILSGKAAFRNGDYSGAIDDWSRELDARPGNPTLVMMLGQAYFAAGKYSEAAVATRSAMEALPKDHWSIVAHNCSELHPHPRRYIFQVDQLAHTVERNPGDSALRFLLGYHYACLGYPQAALIQLDQVVQRNPRDETAVQLRDILRPDLAEQQAPVIIPGGTTPPDKPRRRRYRRGDRGGVHQESAPGKLTRSLSVGGVSVRGF